MMQIFFIIFFILTAFSNNTEEIYGSYRYTDEGMLLNLSPPDHYTIFIAERDKRSGMVTSKEVSRGTFSIENDTLKLSEQMTKNQMTMLVNGEEKLEVLDVKGLDYGATFLCWTGYHENGNPEFEGSWKKGKKHGKWVYYDEEGNVQKTLEYRRGKLKN